MPCIQGIAITFVACEKCWTLGFWGGCSAIGLCRVPIVYFVRVGSLLCVEGAIDLVVRIG